MNNYRFFDSASTTRCCPEAVEALRRYSEDDFGNPSSAHALGIEAKAAIQESRAFLGREFGVAPDQIVFTGSGTEADNLAVLGVAQAALARRLQAGPGAAGPVPRVLASATEHAAVRRTVESLADLGFETAFIPVLTDGTIDRAEFERLLTPNVILVSIHQVNNIVGAIHPVEELAAWVKARVPGAVFHTDAVQAFGKVPHPRAGSGVDLVSISAHKIDGPKGIGALAVLDRALLHPSRLRPLIWGGDQEAGLRSGTQSTALIAAFHAAARRALGERDQRMARTRALRDRFEAGLRSRGLWRPEDPATPVRLTTPVAHVPHILSLCAPGVPASFLAQRLEARRCLVSIGSACSSGKTGPDPVLKAIGVTRECLPSAIRISLSPHQTEAEIDELVSVLADVLDELRKTLAG